MQAIEQHKTDLAGNLPQDEYARFNRSEQNRGIPKELLRNFSNIPADTEADLFGHIYEYFLAEFAMAEGQGGGEFFTPRSVVRLMVEIIEPDRGTILDPACGSGGMFVQSAHFSNEHKGSLNESGSDDLYVCGQEKTFETVKLAKMNLALNGLRGEVKQSNAYSEDPFDSFESFDFVLANPPFNVDEVNLGTVEKDRRFNSYGLPRNKTKKKKSEQGKDNFLHTATVSKADAAQPKNSSQLRTFLGQNKRLVFTLIHKFRYDAGLAYPELSDRDDIIVMVDEAHRTQYASLAENMRKGLPNANFIACTGTPLLGKERKTNAWFGDYVSEYNFQQSMDDGASFPLVYNKRIPEMFNQNTELSEEFYDLLEEADLDEQVQLKLERKFAKEMEVIKRDDRLEAIAADIAYHFPRRGYLGKGIVVSLDKFTAVKMHNKVQRHLKAEIKRLKGEISKSENDLVKGKLGKIVDYLRSIEMAVVISEENGEEEKFQALGLDIKPVRQRMNAVDTNGHDVEYNFKDPDHPLQLVFVRAMWLTGFDAPTVSTLYLDKPMKDHTLMQTIARANRVTSHTIDGVTKQNGEIVDYYNVFRNLKIALKDYALGDAEESPVIDKSELYEQLQQSVDHGFAFCLERGVDLAAVLEDKDTFKKIDHFTSFANTILGSDELRKTFDVYENTITSLYEAAKPEIIGGEIVRSVAAFQYLRGIIDGIIEQQDIDEISRRIGALLDESVVLEDAEAFKRDTAAPVFQIEQKGRMWDLSKIDFDKLRDEFKQKEYKNIEIADMKSFLEKKVEQMLSENVTRQDFAEKLQEIINRYNTGGSATEEQYQDLLEFAQHLAAEDERHVREGLTEDELELFDLIKKPNLTKAEEQAVKLAAKTLLHRLKEEPPKVLVQNWHLVVDSVSRVRRAVEEVLDRDLPRSYNRILFAQKRDLILDTMINYSHAGRRFDT